MTEETLTHAATRVVRYFRIDETRGGGLISQDTVRAVERLRQLIERDANRPNVHVD